LKEQAKRKKDKLCGLYFSNTNYLQWLPPYANFTIVSQRHLQKIEINANEEELSVE